MTKVIYVWIISWGLSADVIAQTTAPPSIAQAKTLLNSEPSKSVQLFETIQPSLNSLSNASQIQWYEVAIKAYNRTLDSDASLNVSKTMFTDLWQHLTIENKQFLTSQFGRHSSIYGMLDTADALFNCALAYSQNENSRLRAINNLGIINIQAKRWESAKETYLSGIAIAKNTNNPALLAAMYNNLGHVWSQLGDIVSAQEAFKQSYIIKTRLSDTNGRLKSLHNLMHSILKRDDWDNWDKYYPLYSRLVDQANVDELSIMKEWMLAYREFMLFEHPPSTPKFDDLALQAQRVQNPGSITFINELATKMSFQAPISVVTEQDKAIKNLPFLNVVVSQCEQDTQ